MFRRKIEGDAYYFYSETMSTRDYVRSFLANRLSDTSDLDHDKVDYNRSDLQSFYKAADLFMWVLFSFFLLDFSKSLGLK